LEYDLARELEKPVYVFVIDEGFPADDYPVEDAQQIRLQTAHRQALTDGRQDYLRAATREEINDKVRSLQLQIEKAQEELQQVDEQVAATSRHLGRRLAWVLAGVLAVIATLGYLVWSGERRQAEAQTVESVQTQIAERFLDQLLASKEISAEEARRRALAELPAVVGLSAAAIQQLIDKKIAPRVQDAALSPLERAKAALAAGDYDAVFAEAGKQRVESRELAILEGTAALARFRGDPAAGLEREGPGGLPARPRPLRRRHPTPKLGPRRGLGSLRPHRHGAIRRGRTAASPGYVASRGNARTG
jgi:hypothetical protein